ncbi:MAG: GGDEF domain-containing protein [Tepidiformaceae bacterium]
MPVDTQQLEYEDAPANRRRTIIRVCSFVLWGAVIALQGAVAARNPSLKNIFAAGMFALLFLCVHTQLLLVQWAGRRHWQSLDSKLRGSAYLGDLHSLPNRNYALAELRREMPRARATGAPFVIVLLTLETLGEVRERRGEDFAERALNSMVDLLRRITRTSDFIAHLDEGRFCMVLNECALADVWRYLRRVPGTIAVSDGHSMFEVPVAARIHQYDMESLYATDVLREAEESLPLRRKEKQERHWTEAA